MPTAGVEVQLYSFYNFGTRCEVGSQGHAPAALPPRKRPDTIIEEAGWTAGPV